MATPAYLEDVLSLAAGLRESELGPAILEMAPAAGDADAVTIDLRVYEDDLRPAIAVQQALQLSVDAAALYVDSATEGRELDFDYAAAFVADRPIEVLVLELSRGSFLARFSVNPKTKAGRDRLLAIGGLATGALVLTGVLAPLAVSAAGGLAFLNQIFTPDAKPPEVPLSTVDPTETQRTRVEAEIVATSREAPPENVESFAYDFWLAGSPEAIDAFLAWVEELRALQGYGRFKDEPERLRIWLSEPLDLDLARATAEREGIEVLRIEPIDAP